MFQKRSALGILALPFLVHCSPLKTGFQSVNSGSSQQADGVPNGDKPAPSPTPSNPSATPSPSPSATPSPTPASSPTPTPTPVAGRPSQDGNISVCAGLNTMPGLDVSDWDHDTQWSEVKGDGKTFAFIKATEDVDFTNPYFARDWADTLALGLTRGAYHFFHPGSDPNQQAQLFLKTLGPLQATDFAPMLDWEVSDGVSAAEQIQNAKIWLDAVEAATGKIPILYIDHSFWNELGNPGGFQRYPLFIAEYGVPCPSIPPPWSTWVFWQQGNVPVPGVAASAADIDIFNGTAAQMLNFARTGGF